ncbi:MAG: endonuclease III [Spirochaetota bacterium]
MQDKDIDKAIRILNKELEIFEETTVEKIASESRSPFKVLISTLISARTKDEVTYRASRNLYQRADTPEKILELSEKEIADLIYPAGFYKTKAKNILLCCQRLIEVYNSEVPADMEEMVTLAGVGRKTANLVMTLGFALPGICVDTHVHRICNRWGYIQTKTPEKTEWALREKLPKKYWIPINSILVSYGQKVCKPISPHCSTCKLANFCEKNDVDKSR